MNWPKAVKNLLIDFEQQLMTLNWPKSAVQQIRTCVLPPLSVLLRMSWEIVRILPSMPDRVSRLLRGQLHQDVLKICFTSNLVGPFCIEENVSHGHWNSSSLLGFEGPPFERSVQELGMLIAEIVLQWKRGKWQQFFNWQKSIFFTTENSF